MNSAVTNSCDLYKDLMTLLVRVSNLRNTPQISKDTDVESLKKDIVSVMTIVLRAGREKAGAEDFSLEVDYSEALEYMDRCRIWISLLLETKAISKYIYFQLSRMADSIYCRLSDSSVQKTTLI